MNLLGGNNVSVFLDDRVLDLGSELANGLGSLMVAFTCVRIHRVEAAIRAPGQNSQATGICPSFRCKGQLVERARIS